MPRQVAVAVENNFRNGLVTQATGLNFPENACTDTINCIFNFDGSVSRRPGLDFEDDFTTKSIDRNNAVVSAYFWKNVAGTGTVSVVVQQVGNKLYFYESDGSGSISGGAIVSTITLTSVSGAPTPETAECQYANGNGKLFVTHPYCDPFFIVYDVTTSTPTATTINIKIRDFEGDTTDSLGIDERPTASRTSMTKAHLYNLYNQGWKRSALVAWDARTDMPSNADIQWTFYGTNDTFDVSNIHDTTTGNSLAPKGYYITSLYDTTRNELVSADDQTTVTTVVETETGPVRPSTCEFFAGRIFFAGITANKFNTNIYFSQIVQRDAQYGYCYQSNDPTSMTTFDLLPDDGGVISIPDAGTILKLIATPGGLVAFAQKGVWLITGSTGIGFTAVDYTVIKLSSIKTLSHTSFVDVLGTPCWWTAEGIYTISSEANGPPSVKSLTFDRIKAYYDNISLSSKITARGVFNYITNVVQWIFKTEATGNINEDYEYDNILNLNMATGAFYPWSITDSPVKINSILLLDGTFGAQTSNDVIDDSANLVIDDSSNQVIAFTATTTGVVPAISYLVSYPDSGSYKFTFASARNTNYLDWLSYDSIGSDFSSSFTSGYKLRGQALRKWQANWLRLYSRNTSPTQFSVRGLWDYATSEDTNRWSNPQIISHNATDYATVSKRVKMRGHGLTLQFMVESVTGFPFELVGWSELDSGNPLP